MHASYACRESGACCTSGWPIPIEADRLAAVERAIAAGAIEWPPGASPGLKPRGAVASRWSPGPSGPGRHESLPTILPVVGDACVFHRSTGAARCALHRGLGHAALPLACRQFPRVVVVDPRGVSITLSHYCPTAASMLDAGGAIAIVTNARAFPADGEYVGLDVRDGLPPALRPDMLMDWDAWWRFEQLAVTLLTSHADPAETLARLAVAVEHVRDWSPADGPLETRVRAAFDAAGTGPPPRHPSLPGVVCEDVLAAVPLEFRANAAAALGRGGPRPSRRAHAAFLAAHAFASWTPHLGEGLRTWLHGIEAAHALVMSGVGVREVDLVLRHLADPHALTRMWGREESQVRRVRQAKGT